MYFNLYNIWQIPDIPLTTNHTIIYSNVEQSVPVQRNTHIDSAWYCFSEIESNKYWKCDWKWMNDLNQILLSSVRFFCVVL